MNYYNEIKNELIKNEINRKIKNYSINRSDLNTYYEVGKLLTLAGKSYGDGIVKQYAVKLTNDLGRKYDVSTLFKMKKFYLIFSEQKMAPLVPQISWSHYTILLPLKDINEINYYIDICIKYNLSKRKLREKIKNKEYERLDDKTKLKLINKEKTSVTDFIKNPIILKNKNNYELVSENVLQRIILEDIPTFLKELGEGFTFIDNEYPVKLGNRYNYIDLLLFNIDYNCYVVVELKVTELKKEHIGQIEVYMNYIDNNLKKINQDKTIGIIICKQDNQYVIKYCSDKRIISRVYEVV